MTDLLFSWFESAIGARSIADLGRVYISCIPNDRVLYRPLSGIRSPKTVPLHYHRETCSILPFGYSLGCLDIDILRV